MVRDKEYLEKLIRLCNSTLEGLYPEGFKETVSKVKKDSIKELNFLESYSKLIEDL